MKVLFVQNIEGIAGSEKYFLALIPELMNSGVEVCMYCVVKNKNKSAAGAFVNLLKSENIPHEVLYVNSYQSLKIPARINRYLKAGKYDILHTHLIYADYWGALIKKFWNKNFKLISTKHGYREKDYVKYCNTPESLPKNLYYYLFKFSHKYTDRSYACSYGLKDFYVRSGLIKPETMGVIQHGFNYPEAGSRDEKYRFFSIQLIVVGRLIPRKGHKFVLNIFPELLKEYPDSGLLILGDGELETELKTLVSQLNISHAVKFLGFKSDVEKYLKASDIAVFPSYSEGLPLVIFEAFNTLVPVVSFDSIGCNELVLDQKTGLLAKAFDEQDLLVKIKTLIADKQLGAKLADNAYKQLKSEFTLSKMTSDTIKFYKGTLSV